MDITKKLMARMGFLKRASTLSVLAVTILLAACGGGDQPNVEYAGTTLLVDTTPYEKGVPSETSDPENSYFQGIVFVTVQPGQRKVVESRLDELGLAFDEYDPVWSLIVHVPIGWEDQWVRALLDQTGVWYTRLDFSISLDPLPGPMMKAN